MGNCTSAADTVPLEIEASLQGRESSKTPLLAQPRRYSDAYQPPQQRQVSVVPSVIVFGASTSQPFFSLSLFSPHPLVHFVDPHTLKPLIFPTAYHLFKALHFNFDTCISVIRLIINNSDPEHAKSVAQRYSDFTLPEEQFTELHQQEVMRRIVRLKLRQHKIMRDTLLESGETTLVFGTKDAYWGIGEDGQGKNMYGQVLMRERKRLQAGR